MAGLCWSVTVDFLGACFAVLLWYAFLRDFVGFVHT